MHDQRPAALYEEAVCEPSLQGSSAKGITASSAILCRLLAPSEREEWSLPGSPMLTGQSLNTCIILHHTALQSNGITLCCRVSGPSSANLTLNVWRSLPSWATLTPHSGGARSLISTNLIRTTRPGAHYRYR